jgi:hypothetical protein
MGMLDSAANLYKELQSFPGAQAIRIAVLRDGNTGNVLHGEVEPSLLGGSRLIDSGDVGMIHERQCLALGLEPGHHLFGVHPPFDELYGYAAPDGLDLFRFEYLSHPPFAEFLENTVIPNCLGMCLCRS